MPYSLKLKTRSIGEGDMRIESDSIGTLEIPKDAYYGIQTYRASQNFQISGTQIHNELITSFLKLKKAAAIANQKCHTLHPNKSEAIVSAVDFLLNLNLSDERIKLKYFIIDSYQAGAGTSQNMNINEVIANKANELLGYSLGTYKEINPNDDVNMSQSTNDVYPTAMRLAAIRMADGLLDELRLLSLSMDTKAQEFDHILKAGRTHLQDAVPIRLGQEFKAYKIVIDQLVDLILHAQNSLRVLGIGGTAVGTSLNVPAGYRDNILIELRNIFSDKKLSLASNMIASMQSQLPMMIYSNALRAASLELTRIMNDLRLLSSGPNTGIAEIILPSTQPGSSIMPGKINPSILEMANQVFFKIIGNDTAMAFAMQAGQLELNVMMPIMAHLALESTHIMSNALKSVRERCIEGIVANIENCEDHLGKTAQIVTALNPIIGYDRAAELTKKALREKKSILNLVKELKILSEEQLTELLNLRGMTEPK